MLKKHAQLLASSHDGHINKLIHAIGLAVFIIGVIKMNALLAAAGLVGGELGHLVRPERLKEGHDRPASSFLSHMMLAVPIQAAIIVYILLAN